SWSTTKRDFTKPNNNPGPADYPKDIISKETVKQNRYPFNQKCPRSFPENLRGKDSPGVGTYYSFQSNKKTYLKPANIPPLIFKRTVCSNNDKPLTFNEEKKFQRRLRY
ncbi:unnamed protein product, partial [Hymenolepis diminuta]